MLMLERSRSGSGFADSGRFAAVSEKTVNECNERKRQRAQHLRFLAAASAACTKATSFVFLSSLFESIAMLDARILFVFAAMGSEAPILHHSL
jgi:hypothetical protein